MADEKIKTVEEFIGWAKRLEGKLLLYRGFADKDWSVEASGYRRVNSTAGNTVGLSHPVGAFHRYISHLLDSAGLQGLRLMQGRELSDLELLAELQHHGAATCLIDFTANSLVALWFACERQVQKDGKTLTNGKVIALATEELTVVDHRASKEDPIKEFLGPPKLWQWAPAKSNNRTVAQHSVFVFGRGKIGKKYYEAVVIDAESKQRMRAELKNMFGVEELHLFGDFVGFAQVNAHNKPWVSREAEDYFDEGLMFHKRRDYQKAILCYGLAIENNSQHAHAYNNRGTAKRKLGDYRGATADYDQAIAIDSQYATAYNNRGLAKRLLGDYQGAIVDHSQAIEIDSQYATAYNNRGLAKRLLGDYQGAIVDHSQAIEIDSQYATVYNNRGLAKCKLDDYRGAIADYDQAIAIDSHYATAYSNRAFAKSELGDHQGAVDDCDKALEIDPQDAIAYSNRAFAKCALGDYQGAIADCDKALEIDPRLATAYDVRGLARRALGDTVGAERDFAKADSLVQEFRQNGE